jgi:D-tagatose-1,6-bisphosphate aldolase subunit GatZ/KbaZ
MALIEILAAQKRGQARGLASICSAHPDVLRRGLRMFSNPLVEATCNQVNQYGGYTGLTPAAFVDYLRSLCESQAVPFQSVILGGDHLGPSVWQDHPADQAMDKSRVLVRDFVLAGFRKIHLDCSMRLADDPAGPLDMEISARRAAQLARAAEDATPGLSRYVIGTEVPIPGGATEHEDAVQVTRVEAARRTIEVTQAAFLAEGLGTAWERVMAVVVQPGVEFGDDFVLPYSPAAARQLSEYIEGQPLVYEAHSTDYQTTEALSGMVRDHFAILKVGPELTFAFREAVFALAMMESALLPAEQRSNLIQVLDEVMLKSPGYWKKYYTGDEAEQVFKRKYSLSDRARYYWVNPEVQAALRRMLGNLGEQPLPRSLLSQFGFHAGLNAGQVIETRIDRVYQRYRTACGEG